MKNLNFTILIFLVLIISSNQTFAQLFREIDKVTRDADRTLRSVDNLNRTIKRTGKEFNKPANPSSPNISKGSSANGTEYSSGPSRLLTFNGGYPITNQLYVDINGKYPDGYKPEWRLVGNPQKLSTNFESYASNTGGTGKDEILVGLIDYQGKTVLNFKAIRCNCVANFDLPIEKLTLSKIPLRLKLINFRKVQERSMDDPDAPCQNMAAQTQGGWKGFIDLSSDNQGNLTMNLLIENYASPRYRNGALMYKWFENEIAIPNMLTPDKAEDKLKSDKKANIDAEIAKKTEAESREKRERLDKLYKLAVIDISSRPAAKPKIVAIYKGYQLKSIVELSDLISKKDREYDQFVVVNKSDLKSSSAEAKLIALQAASTKGNVAAKVHIIEFDLINRRVYNISSWDSSKYEPHETDGKFAQLYLLVNYLNKTLIDIATYIHIGDSEKLNNIDIDRILDSAVTYIDTDEYRRIVEYLKSRK
ncbi:hypothetical protein [Fibrivirga algicola]|uniref:Uncharacterized protein n=1 Tax=Fibrivirga algicola TaxID=2950420 RepID=A0ABX0QQ85_9BACT|nr:hypothetical protein [Fibrivirga algicola]NID13446.1 hypothetical protein [Fibrivirga algicola]